MALPWLTAMEPAFAAPQQNKTPKRFVTMTLGLGLIGENLNPKNSGADYESSLYLKPLEDIRDRFTVISGSSHPGVGGGHRAEASLLTANPVDHLQAVHAGQPQVGDNEISPVNQRKCVFG